MEVAVDLEFVAELVPGVPMTVLTSGTFRKTEDLVFSCARPRSELNAFRVSAGKSARVASVGI
jgi:hypothetical protein